MRKLHIYRTHDRFSFDELNLKKKEKKNRRNEIKTAQNYYDRMQSLANELTTEIVSDELPPDTKL